MSKIYERLLTHFWRFSSCLRLTQEIRLDLHHEVVLCHGAIDDERLEFNTAVIVHRLHDLSRLETNRLEGSAANVLTPRVLRQPEDCAPDIGTPMWGEKPRKTEKGSQ